jgi:hypothetical protein
MAFLSALLIVFTLNTALCAEDSLHTENGDFTIRFDAENEEERKNEWGAAFLSFLLPGAGQHYIQRPRRAALYYVMEAALITGMIYTKHTSNRVMDNAFAIASRDAGTGADFDRENNYWLYLTLFETSDDFNTAVEQGRDFDRKIIAAEHEWHWNSPDAQNRYSDLRARAGDWEDAWAIFVGGMFLNRLVSFIDARVGARNYNTRTLSHLQVYPAYSFETNSPALRFSLFF